MIGVRARLVTAVLGVALAATACGSDGDEAGRKSSEPVSAPSTTMSSSGSSPAADEFCTTLTADGAGPGDAFAVPALFDPAGARTAVVAQLAIIDRTTPPTRLAAAWKAWRGYLVSVRTTVARGTSAVASLNAAAGRVETQRKSLETYAFANCK